MSISSLDSVRPCPFKIEDPLERHPWDAETASRWASSLAWATWAFVGLGIALRLGRYLMRFPLWGDEAFLAFNFLQRDYLGLLKPLAYGQICPALFLWIELTAVRLLGFNEMSLRLFPVMCGIVSMVLFRHVAGRVLCGVPLLLAVGILAVSFHPIRHATEAKPYASDLLAALVLLALAVEWWRAQGRTAWLWILAGIVPLALALSYPAAFVAGGIALGLAMPVLRSRHWQTWIAFGSYVLLMAGSLLLLYVFVIKGQSQGTLANYRRGDWAPAFPPLDTPVRFILWLINMHTGCMFAYPWGGPSGSSTLTTLCFATACVFLWRSGRKTLMLVLLGPFLVGLAAAFLGRYPYGHDARQMQYLAPGICLLAGLGAAVLLRLVPWPRFRPATVGIGVSLLFLTALDLARKDQVHPCFFLVDIQARAFARQFWPNLEQNAEVACSRLDFQIQNPRTLNLRTAIHVCNQSIYSPSRALGRAPDWNAVSAEHPLRCVLYHDTPPDIPEVSVWINRMRERYDLRSIRPVDVDVSAVKAGPKHERWTVLEFVPKASAPERRISHLGEQSSAVLR